MFLLFLFKGIFSFFAPILVAVPPRMKELPYSLDPTEMKHGQTTSVGFWFFSSWGLNQLVVNIWLIYINPKDHWTLQWKGLNSRVV